MREYKIDKSHCIGGWFIDKNVCDQIIDMFKKTPDALKHIGAYGSYNTVEKIIDKNIKDSTDLKIDSNNLNYPINAYRENLQKCLDKYEEKFPEVKHQLQAFNVEETGYVIQFYKKNGGFKIWHSERSGIETSKRVLVFMTYLNNVSDGGTYFKYQNLKIPAKKGLTLIWPSDWTHTHKGQISKKYEKYIATGWYSFIGKNNV
jgi:hypothetical protein